MSGQGQIIERVDALARALADAGVPPELSARLLESASVAALHALTLEQLAAEGARPSAPREPARPVVLVLPATEPAGRIAA